MKYFKLSEFAVSSEHPELVEIPTGQIKTNVENLGNNLLDKIRENIGIPMTITSGYRNKKLNKAVGGAVNSNHLYGYAADCVCGNKRSDNLKMVYAILNLGLDYDEVIIEKGTLTNPHWIHIALKTTGNRKKFLYSPDGKTYRPIKAEKIVNWNLKI